MDYEAVVAFHGHRCPGLAIGLRMTLAAMAALEVSRAGDEELVAIVENDACGVDALQFLSGCTFGKGNLIFRDYGKPAYTLYSRTSGKGVRVLFRDAALPPELRGDREGRLQYILAAPDEVILAVSTVTVDEPKKARIFSTVSCDNCREPVMETRLENVAGRMLCIPCATAAVGGSGRK
jgi:formylmethanofuran dehydrogenase subunit E